MSVLQKRESKLQVDQEGIFCIAKDLTLMMTIADTMQGETLCVNVEE